MPLRDHYYHTGLTLVEIIVGVGLMIFVLLLLFGMLSNIFKSDKNIHSYDSLQQTAFLVSQDLIQEVRWGESLKWQPNSSFSTEQLHDLIVLTSKGDQEGKIRYYVNQGVLYKDTDADDSSEPAEPLTSPDNAVIRFTATNIAAGTIVPLIQFKLELETSSGGTPIQLSRNVTISLRQKQVTL